MAFKKSKRKFGYVLSMLTLVVVGTASWAMYSVANESIRDILAAIGVESYMLQGLIIVGISIGILMLLGTGFFKALEKVLDG